MTAIRMDAAPRRPDFPWPAQALAGLLVTAALVVVAYFFIDQPVMSFFRGLGLDGHRFLKWLTKPPEAFVFLSPLALLAGLIRRRLGHWTRPERAAVAAAVSTLLAALASLALKIAFGRSADGFHPFHFGAAYWAFPSGHTACTLSVTSVAEAAAPRWWPCWWGLAALVGGMLIVLNHHFVGDVLAGAFVGWAIGRATASLFSLDGVASPDTGP